jgi:uncharacterized OB-fold protein
VSLPPKPVGDRDTQPFWDGVAERRLLVPRCGVCSMWIWQPKPLCPRCHAPDPEWIEVSGDARVVSWTVVHPPVLPVWQDQIPFVILLVELEDAPGVRMLGQLVDERGKLRHDDDGVDFLAPLAINWRADEAGQTLPAWMMR